MLFLNSSYAWSLELTPLPSLKPDSACNREGQRESLFIFLSQRTNFPLTLVSRL